MCYFGHVDSLWFLGFSCLGNPKVTCGAETKASAGLMVLPSELEAVCGQKPQLLWPLYHDGQATHSTAPTRALLPDVINMASPGPCGFIHSQNPAR